jgi:hypothetical protein
VEYFNYFGSLRTNYARCERELEVRIAIEKAALSRKKTIFTRKLDLNLKKKRY